MTDVHEHCLAGIRYRCRSGAADYGSAVSVLSFRQEHHCRLRHTTIDAARQLIDNLRQIAGVRAARSGPDMYQELNHVHFLLLPDFPLYALVPATDALRIANQNAGSKLYDWSFVSSNGGAVRSNNGMAGDQTLAIGSGPLPECVIVCAGNEPTQHLPKPLLSW